MKRRVVVTGLGAVTPVGNTVEEFWSSVREGKVGIGPITKFDTSEYKVKLAAEVKGFSAKERMDFKAAKRMEPFAQYAVAAAKEAFEDAKIDMSQENPYRAGVIVGSGSWKPSGCGDKLRKNSAERAIQSESSDGSADDLQYGSRKCFHSAGIQRKMYQCCDSMRIRNPLYRRRISCDCIWRSGSLRGRRCRKLYLPKRRGRIYGADGTFGF